MPELFSDKEENYLNYAKDFQNKHLDRFILQRNVMLTNVNNKKEYLNNKWKIHMTGTMTNPMNGGLKL